jgi:hypothetical protein
VKDTPGVLHRIVDVNLAYKPKPKIKAAKRRVRKEKVPEKQREQIKAK